MKKPIRDNEHGFIDDAVKEEKDAPTKEAKGVD